jgi:hypothetical protein
LSVIAFELISVDETFLAPSFLLEVYKVALILLTVYYVDCVPLSFAILPLAIIAIAIFVRPNAHAMSIAVLPLSDVVLSIQPLELSISVTFFLEEIPLVHS